MWICLHLAHICERASWVEECPLGHLRYDFVLTPRHSHKPSFTSSVSSSTRALGRSTRSDAIVKKKLLEKGVLVRQRVCLRGNLFLLKLCWSHSSVTAVPCRSMRQQFQSKIQKYIRGQISLSVPCLLAHLTLSTSCGICQELAFAQSLTFATRLHLQVLRSCCACCAAAENPMPATCVFHHSR